MTVTLNLTQDVEARMRAAAAGHSLEVENYLNGLITQQGLASSDAAERARRLELLRSVSDIGDENEQRETFEYLKTAIDVDSLSERYHSS
jgi:hypothetical protein